MRTDRNRHGALLKAALLCTAAAILGGCFIRQKCYREDDCPSPKTCNFATGECVYECAQPGECGEGFVCEDFRCVPQVIEGISCPDDMVPVAETFCIDVYEASMPDATPEFSGSVETHAVSVAGVMPWRTTSNEKATAACDASGKRLCTPVEWGLACSGPDATAYGYGNSYEPETCNGIDLFGREHLHVTPAGSLSGCTNAWGVFDMNGNLWEHTMDGDATTVRGGAYNCIDSAKLHKCDYIPGNWSPSALGFRCCLTPEQEEEIP